MVGGWIGWTVKANAMGSIEWLRNRSVTWLTNFVFENFWESKPTKNQWRRLKIRSHDPNPRNSHRNFWKFHLQFFRTWRKGPQSEIDPSKSPRLLTSKNTISVRKSQIAGRATPRPSRCRYSLCCAGSTVGRWDCQGLLFGLKINFVPWPRWVYTRLFYINILIRTKMVGAIIMHPLHKHHY